MDSIFKTLSAEDTLSKLNVSLDKGLSSDDAQKRLQENGPNLIQEKKQSFFLKIFLLFWGPIPWMIEIAAILSGILRRWDDFTLIMILIFFNAFLKFYHDHKAGSAIEALKTKLALKTNALRDGKWSEIEAKDLVPGDIITIKLGNIIPADVKLLKGANLSVDESALTGESLPAEKKIGEQAYSGTSVKMGDMTAVVTETGMNTFFGKTAKLVQEAKVESHFNKAIKNIGRYLIITTLVIAAIILANDLFQEHIYPTKAEHFGHILIFILVLMVAGIPIALPAVVSVTMAIGASRMAAMKAIVAKLIAVEELAGMNILCSDKTGTLTKNQLTVGDVKPLDKDSVEEILLMAALASKKEDADAIDKAIFEKVDDAKRSAFKIVNYVPFDPVKKRSESEVEQGGQKFQVSKGAPQMMLELCKSNEEAQNVIKGAVDEFAKKGFRTLGVAKSDGQNWRFLGLIPLFDPPREDTAQTIELLKGMGIGIKMVTGDHIAIAKEIAHKLNLGDAIYVTEDLFKKDLSAEKKQEMLKSADGFAQVFPEHKFEIVKSLEENKTIVGMTGDGVNDSPALKQANVGIAVGGATDVARSAADLVLTEAGLMVITKAVEESRRIFGRMRSYITYRISETTRLLLFLLFTILVFGTKPLSAIMVILIAVLNDVPIMMIAYDNMEVPKTPQYWSMKEILFVSIGLAVVGVVSTFGLYWIGEKIWLLGPIKSSTLAFMGLLCGGNLTIYLTRNRGFLLKKPFPEWKFFLATLFSQVTGTLISVYGLGSDSFRGIGWKYVGFAWIYILIWFVICIGTKVFIYLFIKNKGQQSFIKKPTPTQ